MIKIIIKIIIIKKIIIKKIKIKAILFRKIIMKIILFRYKMIILSVVSMCNKILLMENNWWNYMTPLLSIELIIW